MPAESAVELARASLVLAFPDASDEQLTRAAELVVRWGSEGVGERLDPAHAERLLMDLITVFGEVPVGRRAYSPRVNASPTRFWTRPDSAPILHPDEPDAD
ncbi:hypothetical protein [Streptomyces sp. SLBN-8D4]|jgi:hypothetical protein|uniref:hypothetical protein n=1 Tax=Streptomyces sp. SLBN-8D4 TaxID=3377728 RepID=UPI003C7A4F86